MWRKLKNVWLSFKTYQDISPDLSLRRRINRQLRDRPVLSSEAWFAAYWHSLGVAPAVAAFAYTHLEHYSGLHIAQVQPSDRLEADLHWTEVCWFDWEMRLCDDVWQCFELDLSEQLHQFNPLTVQDLVLFLQQLVQGQLPQLNAPDCDISVEEINF